MRVRRRKDNEADQGRAQGSGTAAGLDGGGQDRDEGSGRRIEAWEPSRLQIDGVEPGRRTRSSDRDRGPAEILER